MPTYTFATGVPNIVPAVYSTDDTETDLNTDETATASNGVLTLTLDVGDYYAEWTDQGDMHTTAGSVANPAGVQSLGEVESSGSGPSFGYASFDSGGATDTISNQHWTLQAGSASGEASAHVDGVDDKKIVFDADGTYALTFEITPANGAEAAGIQLADAADSFWEAGFVTYSADNWQLALGVVSTFFGGGMPNLFTLPPLQATTGDHLAFSIVVGPAAATAAVRLHVTRTA